MKRARSWLIGGAVVLSLFVTLLVITAFLPEDLERAPASVTNPRPQGARALGQVLVANGVALRQVTSLDDAAAAPAGSTLVVHLTEELSSEAEDTLSASRADLVILLASTGYGDLGVDRLSAGLIEERGWYSSQESAPRASCADPDAIAAGTLTAGSLGVRLTDDTGTICFPGNNPRTGLYADALISQRRVTVIAGRNWFRNDTITQEGNAALALRAMGRHTSLLWYLPRDAALAANVGQEPEDGRITDWSMLPDGAQTVLIVLLIAAGGAALWRGRRFGALVPEPLPVQVPASEAAAGLGRLYQQAGARGHAAAALRAATIHQVAARLGVPASATPVLVTERLSNASRRGQAEIFALLYGPPPTTDLELVELADRLSDLEREVTTRD